MVSSMKPPSIDTISVTIGQPVKGILTRRLILGVTFFLGEVENAHRPPKLIFSLRSYVHRIIH